MTEGHDPRLLQAERLLGCALSRVRPLPGGTHAVTLAAETPTDEVVVRFFPAGDTAVRREMDALGEIGPLRPWFEVPQLLAADPDAGVIVTTLVPGGHPDPALPPEQLAVPLAEALARIHDLAPGGLPSTAVEVTGQSALAAAARGHLAELVAAPHVLSHGDFWCGNALWYGAAISGVVDWSGARAAPAGLDVAWCRQDLVLLGSRAAADLFLDAYLSARALSGSVLGWDLHAAAHAEGRTASWEPNYVGIGRAGLTGDVLDRRFADWADELIAAA